MKDPYVVIILSSLLIVFSYLFTQISKFSKIPSVLFLIGTGIAMQFGLEYFGINLPDLSTILGILGIIGLMMIVLEGALDIKIHRNNIRTILAAFASSVIILAITNSLIACIIYYTQPVNFINSFLYSIPLSVVSSAIVIPSVHKLIPAKKEFMVIEATLSDIFGIMLFSLWIKEPSAGQTYAQAISWNIIISITLSIILSYLLVYLFHKIKTKVKFFLFLAILALLLSIGEYFHYSALLIILIFGLILNNTHAFFKGFLKKIINHEKVTEIRNEFVMITNETSFLIRTFFFVVFGLTMNLEGLLNEQIIIISIMVMVVIYLTRALNLKVFIKSTIFPQMLIAPRGLVTILLFQQIMEHYGIIPFNKAILAWVIIGTNLIMMFGLIFSGSSEDDILRINIGDASSDYYNEPNPPA
ncbi:MAG TPA: cation:proton antiporter [Bacteroidia bacterium]|nr:cation:proton antiporter [Bacteroidia bacterium]